MFGTIKAMLTYRKFIKSDEHKKMKEQDEYLIEMIFKDMLDLENFMYFLSYFDLDWRTGFMSLQFVVKYKLEAYKSAYDKY